MSKKKTKTEQEIEVQVREEIPEQKNPETEETIEKPEAETEEIVKPDPPEVKTAETSESPEVETEEIVKPDPTEVETRGQKKWSFPTASKCPRCGITDTICRNTNIITGTQYRQCQRAICRYNYSVKGTKV